MFWETAISTDQQYGPVLENEDVEKITLEELIDKLPNLVSEYDVGNEKLIKILKRRDILESLIKNVTETPGEHLSENERFKYANQSCVLFSSKSNEMEQELIQQQDLLDRLIDFLRTDEELNPLMASFFENTLFQIYNKFPEQMVAFFNAKQDFFDLLFKHIHTSAIIVFLLKLTSIESLYNNQRSSDVYRLFNYHNLIKRIVDVFRSNHNQNALENASYLLIYLIQNGRQSLINEEEEKKFYMFYNESFLEGLIEICFTHKSSAIHILRVLVQFIDSENHLKIIDAIKEKLDSSKNVSSDSVLLAEPLASLHMPKVLKTVYSIKSAVSSVATEYLASVKNLHKVFLLNLDKFKGLLLESVPDYSVQTTTGLTEKPLGFLRLEIVNFFYALLLANNPEMDAAFAKSQILQVLIDLFFEYEFNSFLHNHVNNIVTTIFLNANSIRFKFLINEQEKAEFLSLDSIEKCKEKNLSFMQVINLVWSDDDCFENVKKFVHSEEVSSPSSPPSTPPPSNLATLEYTPLIAQLFNECNLVERIMNKLRLILNEKDTRKAIPTHKSNLIDIADVINNYLNEYERSTGGLPEQLMQTNFASLREEWQKFTINEFSLVKKRICDVEQSIKSLQNAQQDFIKFIFQDVIKPLDFKSPYSVEEYQYGEHLFQTPFDREIKNVENPELPDISKVIDQTVDSLNSYKCEIELFSRRFDEEKSIEDEEKRNEMKSTSEETEQYSQASEQIISSLTEKDNIFQPLASSSNISNELNIEMDIEDSDIVKEGDDNAFEVDSFERSSTTAVDDASSESIAVGDKDRGNETKLEQDDDETAMKIETQPKKLEDEDWANFEKFERTSG